MRYDFDGKLLWKKDLGVLNAGWFFDPDYEWGIGSSPIIYKNMVIVQCRHPARLVHRRVRHGHRQGGLAHAARRDPLVVHADDLRGRTARRSSSRRRRPSRAATIR